MPQWFGAFGEMYDAETSSGMSPSVVVRFHPSSATTLSTVRACLSCSDLLAGHPGTAQPPRGVPERDLHDPFGTDIRERIDQHAIHDAEHSARGADPEREGDDGREREAGTTAELPRGVAQVGQDGWHVGLDDGKRP